MHKRELQIGQLTLSLETGKLAKQADGSVIVRQGDTMVLVTACHSNSPREGIDFLPLTVDYREYAYSSGRIPGGFFKREGKATEKEVLTSRCIDRPIRPLFPAGWRYETQIIAFVLSADTENDADVLAITGASAALALSEMPFEKTIAGVRVGLVDGEYVINPTFPQRKQSRLDLVVAGSKDGIVMVEAGAKEVSEEEAVQALEVGHKAIREICDAIDALAKDAGRTKLAKPEPTVDTAFEAEIHGKVLAPLTEAMRIKAKLENYAKVDSVLKELVASLPEEQAARKDEVKSIFKALQEKVLRDEILERNVRLDGRRFDEIRPIWIESSVLPRVHGSSVFTRGETQALVTATLGTADDQQKIEMVDGEMWKRFMLHYNFPPFSVGETGFMGSPKRREIGHGNLARRGISAVMPDLETFPYVIRVVSEVLESNGSSSMASVCGTSLALMDAGVPIKGPVAGVAMGLVKEGERFAVLTDILGDEDHLGDMDFKVAGTANGVTALQMDIKINGITAEIMKVALEQAKAGRLHILGEMNKVLDKPRPEMSAWAPTIITIKIDPEKIRDVIGKGGSVIRQITEETGATIDIENDGTVKIASVDGASGREALRRIEMITADVEVGRIYEGKVVRLMDFGAFVAILPGRDGLVHISQISDERVERVSDKLKEGDVVKVKVLEVDRQGRVRLSMRGVA